MSAHSRRVQSNGAANPASSERSRIYNGSFGSGSMANMSHIWTDSPSANTETPSGSSTLLPSSDADGWSNNHRNLSTWPPRPQANGIATSPVQSRSGDANGISLANGTDTNYFAQPGQNYLATRSERVSPSGEGNAMDMLANGDIRRALHKDLAPSYQAQSGYTPLDNRRSDGTGALKISSSQNPLQQLTSRNGYAHASRNSTSFAPQRPAHNHYPSFHSDRQFDEVSTGLDRLQLNETQTAASRPQYISRNSLDTALARYKSSNPGDEAGYPVQQMMLQGYANEISNRDTQVAYQQRRSSHLGENDLLVSPTEYTPTTDAPYYIRQNTSRRYRNDYVQPYVDNMVAMQNRVRELQSLETTHTLPQQPFIPSYDHTIHSPTSIAAHLYSQFNPAVLASRHQPPHRPTSQESQCSPVLQEFRANYNKTKRCELKEIYGHICEFSGDQFGSRALQIKLETANSDEKERVFQEVLPNCMQLSQDIFGNYVVQKLFEHGNQAQKKLLAQKMKGNIFSLSSAPYGCRVIQKALEHVLVDQQASMVKELEEKVLECVQNNNGNHVIQKAIERVPTQYTKFVVDAFRGQVEKQAMHSYGCRVIQRMLEHCEEADRRALLTELHACTAKLIEDQFGNYVIQHVIQHGEEADRSIMIEVVKKKLISHSKHKFASNVVEKSIEFGNETQRREIIGRLIAETPEGERILNELVGDQYGNYVVQKILNHLKGAERLRLVERIRPLVGQLKKYNCSKQIAAIEKLIGDLSPTPTVAIPASNNPSTTPPNSHKSSPQPLRRSVEDRFVDAPPTPPPTDNQPDGADFATTL
ncbi:armadillo-type protein [Aspergillus granulosus]|uniref:Armadillo-type protein n=1 Tax=Aspergillus granulosus TaxID=176169 RepID=A0ABR4HKE8_9EURO